MKKIKSYKNPEYFLRGKKIFNVEINALYGSEVINGKHFSGKYLT